MTLDEELVREALDTEGGWKVLDRPVGYINIKVSRTYIKDANQLRSRLTGERWDGYQFRPAKQGS